MTTVAAVFWVSLPLVAGAFTFGMWTGAALHVCRVDIKREGEQ